MPGLSWYDVGCGTGSVLRAVRDRWAPASLAACDLIDWLDDDLRDDVEMTRSSAEAALPLQDVVDRVIMCESLEHTEAPWSVLRAAARSVAPGGRLIVSVPNVAALRQRLDLLLRGHLTSYPPENEAHLTPILPHVALRILRAEGFSATFDFAGDLGPPAGRWPSIIRSKGRLAGLSVVITAVDIRHRLIDPAPW